MENANLLELQVSSHISLQLNEGYPLKIFTHILNKTDLDCVLSYCHYSLNDDSLSSLFPLLQSKGVGITRKV